VALPADAVTMLPAGDGKQQAQLEVRIGALDDTGASAPIPAIPMNVSSAGPPGPGATFRYATTLELRNRPHKLLVAVHDVAGGNLFSASTDVAPPR
jgi:hypothetical protein